MDVRDALEELAVNIYWEAGSQGGEVRRLVFDADSLASKFERALWTAYNAGYEVPMMSEPMYDPANGITAGVAAMMEES